MSMTQQGHYKCPKCSSTDSYDGTTLVSTGSVGIAREVGDSGTYLGISGARTQERTVRKCRKCGEVLGKKDYTPSPAEHDVARKDAAFNDAIELLGIILFAVAGGYAGGNWNREQGFSFWTLLCGVVIGASVGFIFVGLISTAHDRVE